MISTLCRESLEAFESLTGLSITLHVINRSLLQSDGQEIVPVSHHAHVTPFCLRIKTKAVDRCYLCDNRDLQQECRPDSGPFARRCHAGAWEVVAPIYRWNTLAGMLFIGQYRTPKDNQRRGLSTLPVMETNDVDQLIGMARMITAFILSLMDVQENDPETTSSRRGEIEAFIDRRIGEDVRLGDLASHLGLSTSRTSHLVKEQAGTSFRTLKEKRRIAMSKDLLAHGKGSIRWVAEQVGMTDPDYFCRYFKRKTGQSPTTFRKKHGRRTV